MAIPPRPRSSPESQAARSAPPPAQLPLASRKERNPIRIKWNDEFNSGFTEVETDNDSNWIVSYADMMTLLMSFFALMFSFSSVDQKEFDRVRSKVAEQFGGQFVMPFENVNSLMKQVVRQEKLEEDVQIDQDAGSVNIVFRSAIFFEAGTTELKSSSKILLEKIIDVIVKTAKGNAIHVEGHTDDSPIATGKYPSNWELSAARASFVVRIFEAKGFPKAQLNPVGFADSRPLLPNRDEKGKALPENQAQNRRVVIRISRK